MSQYTIEDIEILRQKSGISYEEAVNLLNYHNGSLARALVDLEKNGRLHRDEKDEKKDAKGGKGVFNYLYCLRLKVSKNGGTVVNLSSIFVVFVVLVKPTIAIVGLIASLLLGYRITVVHDCDEFAEDTLESVLKNAKSNVQNTVDAFAQQFAHNERPTQDEANDTAEEETPRSEGAASGTRPVNVQFPREGGVSVHDDGDGFHEADIQ